MKKPILVALIVTFVVAYLIAGCAIKNEAAQPVRTAATPVRTTVTIVDDVGRKVEIPQPLERVVAINGSYGPEILLAFGVRDRIAGVADYAKERAELASLLKDVPAVGKSSSPNTEKVLQLNPEVLIAYESFYPYPESLTQALDRAGIKLVVMDFHKPEIYARNVRTLGMLLGKEKRAEDLIGFERQHLDLIEQRVKDLKPEQRVRVYLELYKDYQTVAPGHPDHEGITLGGGINVFAGEPVKSPTVSPEAVVSRNPQVIIKHVSKDNLPESGYGVTDTRPMENFRSRMMKRPGWDHIDAVKNGRVYVISTDAKSTHPSIFYSYYAKAFYPDRFQDTDPVAAHREWFRKFLGIEYKGLYAYPSP